MPKNSKLLQQQFLLYGGQTVEDITTRMDLPGAVEAGPDVEVADPDVEEEEAGAAVWLLTMTDCTPEFHTDQYTGVNPLGDPPSRSQHLDYPKAHFYVCVHLSGG